MRILFAIPALALAAIAVSCGDPPRTQPSLVDHTPDATSFVQTMAARDFATAVERFDAAMRAALPKDRLRAVWDGLTQQSGAFQRPIGTRSERTGGYDVVFVTCEFERAHLDAKVVFDADGAIAGLFFLPAADAAPPPYVSRSRFDEREVHLGADPWQLPGTLSVPKGAGPFPAIVLVHGSGPQDRDETVGANKPFRDLAWGLASRGIAVLRYDKRTLHCAAKLQPLPLPFTVNEETVDDVTAAVTVLRATPEIDSARVFVLGHSLGGMLVPRIAKRTPDAAGFAILAGTARPLEDVIIEQTNYIALLDGAKSMDEQKQIDAVQAEVNRIKALTQADTQNSALIFGVPASYWLDLRAYDPVAEADSIARPLLILQGQRDYQVTMTDFARWKSALGGRPNVTLKTYAALNHLFIAGAGASGPAEYAAPGHVAPKVIDDIAAWMNAR